MGWWLVWIEEAEFTFSNKRVQEDGSCGRPSDSHHIRLSRDGFFVLETVL